MVKVQMLESGIRMEGHAGCWEREIDRACAGISALTCSLINSLQDLAGEEIRMFEYKPGFVHLEWENLSEKGKLLVDAWCLGITAINQEYNCIKFI